MRSQPDGLPSRSSGRPARDFSVDAPQDTVILSVRDLAAAQEAVRLDRQDREDERRTGEAPETGDGPAAGAGSDGPGTPESGNPPAAPPAGPPPAHPPAGRPDPSTTASGSSTSGRLVPSSAARGSAGSGGPPRAASPPPSWLTVLLTTVRLWVQRHWPARTRWRVVTVLVLAAAAFGAGAITIALTSTQAPAGHTHGGTQARAAQAPTPAAIRAAAAARTAAARWVAAQASPGAIISCDPQMCAQLQAHGVPAAGLLPLGASNPAPLGSDLIVSTAAVRSEFGARLSSVYAPTVLASFGTGSAQTAVRVVAAEGSAAYLHSLRTDVAARASAGRQLLQNPRLHPSASVRRALAAGQFDARLLTAFAALATMHKVDVVDFPAAAPGASAGMPLRAADIAPAGPGTRRRPDTIGSLSHFLQNQLVPYRPAHITVYRLASGRSVLRLEYGAPSPLGLLGKG